MRERNYVNVAIENDNNKNNSTGRPNDDDDDDDQIFRNSEPKQWHIKSQRSEQ